MLLVLAGCGGGSPRGSGIGSDIPPAVEPPKIGTARFSVNVETGKVTVTPLGGNPKSRAVFTGTAVAFQSSDLLNDTGEITRRRLSVRLKNNTNEPIGVAGSGLKVMFGDFKTGVATDLRSRTNVSTFAGSGSSATVDGPVQAAGMSSPHAVLADDNGNIYFSGYDQRLRVIKNGQVSTVTSASTGPVVSLCWNRKGTQDYIYGASLNTHKILRIKVSTGDIEVIGGTGSVGGDDGPAGTSRFNLPYGIADMETGSAQYPDLIVSEGTTGKLRTLKYNGTTYVTSTLPFTVDAPRGMTSLGNGLYAISQAFLRKIAIFNTSGVVANIGNGANGQGDGDGNSMTFYEPIGCYAPVPFSQGGNTLYVSESGGVIRQLSLRPGGSPSRLTDWKSATLAGVFQAFSFADGPGDAAKFLGPVTMTMDRSGNLLVADSGNSRIRMVTPTSGNFPFQIGNEGSSTGVDKVRLANPTDYVPTDAGPSPYILENKTVGSREDIELTPWSLVIPEGVKTFEFIVTIEAQTTTAAPPDAVLNPGPGTAPGSSRAMVRTLSGQTTAGFSDGSVSGAVFNAPTAFAYDASGVLYVADADNRAIRRITPGGQVTTVAGVRGTAGTANGLGTVASFGMVTGIAVTPAGDALYVADSTNHLIRRIALVPASDPSKPASWNVSTIAGTMPGTPGNINGTGTVARFNRPWGIVLTQGGDLVVSEMGGNRLRKLRLVDANPDLSQSWIVSLLAGQDGTVSPAGASADGAGSAARFNEPRGIALAASGEIYVADRSNGLIRRVDVAGNVTTLAGSTPGYGDNDSGTSAQFLQPTDVAVDRAGYVYVSDSGNFLLRRVSPAGAVRTIAGYGAAGTVDGAGNVARFTAMNAVEISNAGDVVIGDGSRIRLVQRVISTGVTQ